MIINGLQTNSLLSVKYTILQQREGDANKWERWSSLSNLMFLLGSHQASAHQSLKFSVDVHCQSVHIYLLHINSILLTHCVLVMVRIVQNQGDVFSLYSTRRLTLVLTSPYLRWKRAEFNKSHRNSK